MEQVCISTQKSIVNDPGAVVFVCPQCSKHKIVRSTYARKNAIGYTCPACGFTGPN